MDLWYFLITALVSSIFLFMRHKNAYWKERNVPHLQPVFPLGNLYQLKSFNMLEKLKEIYTNFKGTAPFAGIYLFTKPAVVAMDLEFIKAILIKDFTVFTDRLQYSSEEHDPLSGNLFSVKGDKWKRMRAKLSPTFTSAKMKFMFPTITAVAKELENTTNLAVAESSNLEIRDLLSRFTTDVIGTCVFGIQCNSLNNPNADFCSYGRSVMEKPGKSNLFRHFLNTFSDFTSKLGFAHNDAKRTNYIMKIIAETVAQREANNIHRNDFMDLLIELKNQKNTDGSNSLSIEEIAAQAFVFFVAGFESSASNMGFTLFELSRQPALQDKVREEIRSVLTKHDNVLTYEAMSEMTYLSQCVEETLRMYPALASLTRVANADYPVPNTKLVIEKGTPVIVPVWSIQNDPDIYPEPTHYNPDRFSGDNVQLRDAMTFLAFGDGPRNCIGQRFGRMQVRIGLITLLRSFKFSASERTPQEITLNPKSMVMIPKDKLWLKVEAI